MTRPACNIPVRAMEVFNFLLVIKACIICQKFHPFVVDNPAQTIPSK